MAARGLAGGASGSTSSPRVSGSRLTDPVIAAATRIRNGGCCSDEHRTAYASVELGDETVAVGRSVAEAGWAGVFGIATRPEARGKGAAGAVLGALADWAAVNDAPRMYLQVEHENEGAMRLYGRVGFRELAPFSFRVKKR